MGDTSDWTYVQGAINFAIENGRSAINLPRGTYRLEKALIFKDCHDIIFEGNGSRLVFTEMTNSGIVLQATRNITFQNFTEEWDPLPCSQGKIIAIDSVNQIVDIEIEPGYNTDISKFTKGTMLHVFDHVTRRFKIGGGIGNIERIESPRPGVLHAYYSGKGGWHFQGRPLVGDLVFIKPIAQLDTRKINGLVASGASGTQINNVTIFNGPGWGILEGGGEGGTVINNLSVLRGPRPKGATTDPLISTIGTAVQSDGVKKGPRIENSHFEFMGDDGINIFGLFNKIISVNGNEITS